MEHPPGERDSPDPSGPPAHHGHRCRQAVDVAMRALLDLLDATATDGTVSVDTVRRIAQAVMGADGALTTYYDQHAIACAAFFELGKAERKRTDYFERLLTTPLIPLLEDPHSGIQHSNLPQLFAALRMILGDELCNEYRDRCAEVADELRAGETEVPWDEFYADQRCTEIFEDALAGVARSFKRFAPRKDWFLIVMNNDPHSVSLGSNVFVPKKSDEKNLAFGAAHFVLLFRTLFEPVRPASFEGQRRESFIARQGATPQAVFGNLFVELTGLQQRQPAVAPRRGVGIETSGVRKRTV